VQSFESVTTQCVYEREDITCMGNRLDRYIKTYLAISRPTHRLFNEFKAIVELHGNSMPKIHTIEYFLPWHRKLLLLFEAILQKENCAVTIPYWPYEFHPANPFVYPPFDQQTFGGNGVGTDNCVRDGPFASPGWTPPGKTSCLTRIFKSESLLPTVPQLNLAFTMVSQSSDPYTMLSNHLESIFHNNGHSTIAGDMLTFPAPNSPEFFPLHANLDRMWDFAQKNTRANMNSYPFADVPMPFFTENVKPSDMASSDALGIRYVHTKTISNNMPASCSYVKLNNGWFLIPDLEQKIIMAPFTTISKIPQNAGRSTPLIFAPAVGLKAGDSVGVTMEESIPYISEMLSVADTINVDRFMGIDLNRVVTALNIQPVCPITAFSCGTNDGTISNSLTSFNTMTMYNLQPTSFNALPLYNPQTFNALPLYNPQSFNALPLYNPQSFNTMPLYNPQLFSTTPLYNPQSFNTIPQYNPFNSRFVYTRFSGL